MIKGTTPMHTFGVPSYFDVNGIKSLEITYAQDDNALFVKGLSDCEINGQDISTKLTQEETFLFDVEKPVQIQIRILTIYGDVVSSDIILTMAKKCLDNEVLQ